MNQVIFLANEDLGQGRSGTVEHVAEASERRVGAPAREAVGIKREAIRSEPPLRLREGLS